MNYYESFTTALRPRRDRAVNVGKTERVASALAGGALVAYAIRAQSKLGIFLGLFGAGLVYRGATGTCDAYRRLGINTADAQDSEEVAREVHIEESITINRPPEELFSFWRNFHNLPRFMTNLESVRPLGGNRSHWVATGPAGKMIEWEAEIYNEKENELIAWRSLPESDVVNAGSVNFKKAPGGRGTYVKVTVNYNPPGGKPGVLLAKLFGREPGQMVKHSLKTLKQLFETGVISTIEGQTSGREQPDDYSRGREPQPESARADSPSLAHEAKGGVQ